ncbi:MAG TPA: hypothetical protein H9684_03475 [Firmicutes bacterium]|nr:hypothetical protein [Bacillota bacterium]
MSTEHCFDRSVVVGYWPVVLYGDKIRQANPVINCEKKIVSIVGDCGLNRDGQPNLLIIPGSTAATTCIPPASTGCPCFMLRPRRRVLRIQSTSPQAGQ